MLMGCICLCHQYKLFFLHGIVFNLKLYYSICYKYETLNLKLKKNGAELSEKYVKYENLGPEVFLFFPPI